jgi:hypothetical protein
LLNSNNTMVSPGILLQQRDAWLVQGESCRNVLLFSFSVF